MNPTDNSTSMSSARTRRLLGLLALAVTAAVLAHHATRDLAQAEAQAPAPASVDRFGLETREGRLHRPGASVPFTGWVTDHFASGTVNLRTAVVDGRLHGESEGWFTNGVRELHEEFQRGLPHGLRTTWHANGRKRSEGRLVAGQQQGTYRQWHENGTLVAEAEFEAGKPHGFSWAWYPGGCLKAEALMKNGEIQARHVYPDGERREPTLLAENRIP